MEGRFGLRPARPVSPVTRTKRKAKNKERHTLIHSRPSQRWLTPLAHDSSSTVAQFYFGADRWTLRPPNSHKKRSRSSFFLRSMALSGTPWTLFLGAGKETFTKTVSRCFPITFFAGLTSEDLNCSLIFHPRQQVRPETSSKVQGHLLSASSPHLVHRRLRWSRTHQ